MQSDKCYIRVAILCHKKKKLSQLKYKFHNAVSASIYKYVTGKTKLYSKKDTFLINLPISTSHMEMFQNCGEKIKHRFSWTILVHFKKEATEKWNGSHYPGISNIPCKKKSLGEIASSAFRYKR